MVYVLVMNTASFSSVDGDGPNQNDDVMSKEDIIADREESRINLIESTKIRKIRSRKNNCKYYGTIFAVLIAVIGLALLFIYLFTPVFDDRMPSIR